MDGLLVNMFQNPTKTYVIQGWEWGAEGAGIFSHILVCAKHQPSDPTFSGAT